MHRRLFVCLFTIVCLALPAEAASKKFTLVIDAGHGGKDPGSHGSFAKEKTVALNVALAFGRYVENNCPDVKVIYTRKTDVFIPLQERANIANRNKADLFVSIHCNALPKGKISRGMETYTLGMHRANDNLEVAKRENEVILIEDNYKQRYAGFDPRSSESYIMFELIQDNNMSQSVEMARQVQQKVCGSLGRPNKGVKQAGFLVLRETSMPSCLIELGFITTPDEERLLTDKQKVDALGRSIYQAFAAYKKKVKPEVQVPFKPTAAPRQEAEVPQLVPQADKAKAKEQPAASHAATPPVAPADDSRQPAAADAPAPTGSDPQADAATATADSTAAYVPPVFKVQIAANPLLVPPQSRTFKGHAGVEHYKEGGLYKYTLGASANYQDIYKLNRDLQADFPGAFIVAFRGGEKMNVNEAIREYKANKNKK